MSNTCSVCQDIFKNPKLLMCGHTFCRKCIDQIIKCQPKKDIKCPNCRKITNLPTNGAKDLVDNYFVADRRYDTTILKCKGCNNIARNKPCKFCGAYVCDKCVFSHSEKNDACNGTPTSLDETKTLRESSAERDRDRHEVGLHENDEMTDACHSKFHFELLKKVVVPNLFWTDHEHEINIHLSSLACFDDMNCIVAPNGNDLVLIYDKHGNELLREMINIRVVDIAMGIRGYPLVIENSTSTIYEYSFGSRQQLFCSRPLLPYAISSLNDGRIVLVGTITARAPHELEFQMHGAMQVYEYYGQIVSETYKENGRYLFDFPIHVSVNKENNDIYVGDSNKNQIMYFKEDCSFLSSYRASESVDAYVNVGGNLIECTHSLLSLTYATTSQLLLTSFHSRVGGKIHVLSSNLQFLGFFHCFQDVGVPVGMSADNNGNFFFGDNSDDIIRVFKLSEYINKL